MPGVVILIRGPLGRCPTPPLLIAVLLMGLPGLRTEGVAYHGVHAPTSLLSSPDPVRHGEPPDSTVVPSRDRWPSVQLAFLVEVTPYDGAFDPSRGVEHGLDPCLARNQSHPCEESNGAPFVFRYASTIARGIVAAHPGTAISFALVHYGAYVCDGFGGCSGDAVYADVPGFVPADNLSAALNLSPAAVSIANGSLPGSGMNQSLLHSDSITALYGVLAGGTVNWTADAHHVVVQIGSTAPRAPGFTENYSVSASGHAENRSTADWLSPSCEPPFVFRTGGSPTCEGWLVSQDGNASHAIAPLTRNGDACRTAEGGSCTLDEVDLWSTASDAASLGWPAQFAGTGGGPNGSIVRTDVARILSAGCGMAQATGGSWDGPTYSACGGASGTLVFEGWNATVPQSGSLLQSLLAVGLGNASRVAAYPLAFHETGLLAGTNWSVQVAGLAAESKTAWIVVPEWNGSYGYRVAPIAGYVVTNGSGVVSVLGGNATVAVVFAPATYPVTFTESGLPVPTGWGLSIDATRFTSGPSIQLSLPNGSYPYVVDPPEGFTPSPESGVLAVNGAPREISIVFTANSSTPVLSASISVRHLSQSCLPDGGVTDTVELTANATGGSPPYAYHWSLPTANLSGESVGTTLLYGGNRTIALVVSDTAGRTVRESMTVGLLLPPCPPVVGREGSSHAMIPPILGWALAGTVSAGVVAAVLVYLVRRRRARSVGESPKPRAPHETESSGTSEGRTR